MNHPLAMHQHTGTTPASGPPSLTGSFSSASGGGGTPGRTTTTGTTGDPSTNQQHQVVPQSAVPILKVMRLQGPELGRPSAGETFTAYLGAINPSSTLPVLGLAVAAQLQTPTRRWALPSRLDITNNEGGVPVVPPGDGINAIVSRSLEEVGEHILRVEVGYGGNKTLRKFYRFNVASPLHIRELTLRAGGDASCFVNITIENATTNTTLTIASAEFQPPTEGGLIAERIDRGNTRTGGRHSIVVADAEDATTTSSTTGNDTDGVDVGGEKTKEDNKEKKKKKFNAVELYDNCGRLKPGSSFRYMFHIHAATEEASLRGIACGDELGKAIFTWRKPMGETGRIASTSVLCPPAQPPGGSGGEKGGSGSSSNFVVHGSGLAVDAALRGDQGQGGGAGVDLNESLPVTVEPVDPVPSEMELAVPRVVQLLVVNHSDKTLNLQLQMRLAHMSGIVVCGPSFKNLGEISGNGGNALVAVRLVPLVAGLFRCQGCFVVDLTTGREIPQPALFNVFVDKKKRDQ